MYICKYVCVCVCVSTDVLLESLKWKVRLKQGSR